MVFFRSLSDNTVTIFESESDTEKNGTTLEVPPQLIPRGSLDGKPNDRLFLPCWSERSDYFMKTFDGPKIGSASSMLELRTSHDGTLCDYPVFTLLCHRIRSKEARWGTSLRTPGEFGFLDGYWDWLENVLGRAEKILEAAKIYDAVFASLFHYDHDTSVIRAFCEFWCPATNTLHTSRGEVTISLWDLYKIGGLPIVGLLYDETIPTLGELAGTNKGGKPLPPSCQYLFLAYHRLYQLKKKSPVKFASWVDFWYKGTRYHVNKPIKNVRNKTQGPKETFNPSGVIPRFGTRTNDEQAVFDGLGVPAAYVEETYLAAFLSCWLCKFVFPRGADQYGVIRPSVFKTASLMAQGSTFSLGVPVLANLYHGLNQIGSSEDPGNCGVVMPYHYLYGWLSVYFDTYFAHPENKKFPMMVRRSGKRQARLFDDDEARALFLSPKEVSMNMLARSLEKEETLIDDKDLSYHNLTYFISMRSHFLATRFDGHCMTQPYSPERFSRQFGYQQHLPHHLTEDVRLQSLEMIHNHSASFLSISRGSTVTLPSRKDLQKFQVSEDYIEWWSKVFRPDEDPNVTKTLRSKKVIYRGPRIPAATYSTAPCRQIRASSTEHPQVSEEKVVKSDIPKVQDRLKRKKVVAHMSPLRSTGSSGSEDCHFKRKRTETDTTLPKERVEASDNWDIPMDDFGFREFAEVGDNEFTIDDMLDETYDMGFDHDCPKSPTVSEIKETHSSATNASSSTNGDVDGVNLADVLLETTRHMTSIIEDKVKDIVLKSVPELLPSVVSGLDGFYDAMLRNGVDPAPLKTRVNSYVTEVNKLSFTKSVCSKKMSRKVATESLARNASDMKKVLAIITKKSDNCKTLQDKIVVMESKKAELIAQLDSVQHSLIEEKSELDQHQSRMTQLTNERELLKSTPVSTPDEDELLATYEEKIAGLQTSFQSST